MLFTRVGIASYDAQDNEWLAEEANKILDFPRQVGHGAVCAAVADLPSSSEFEESCDSELQHMSRCPIRNINCQCSSSWENFCYFHWQFGSAA